MKKLLLAITLTLSLLTYSVSANAEPVKIDGSCGQCDVYFSPKGGVTEAVIQKIDEAKDSIYVMSYSFTSNPIADALIRAVARGVKVSLVVDGKQLTALGSDVRRADDAGVDVWMDKSHAIHHNKVMVIDGNTLITGSFNWSAAAESSNAENLIICPTTSGSSLYVENFYLHRSHSIELNDINFPR